MKQLPKIGAHLCFVLWFLQLTPNPPNLLDRILNSSDLVISAQNNSRSSCITYIYPTMYQLPDLRAHPILNKCCFHPCSVSMFLLFIHSLRGPNNTQSLNLVSKYRSIYIIIPNKPNCVPNGHKPAPSLIADLPQDERSTEWMRNPQNHTHTRERVSVRNRNRRATQERRRRNQVTPKNKTKQKKSKENPKSINPRKPIKPITKPRVQKYCSVISIFVAGIGSVEDWDSFYS